MIRFSLRGKARPERFYITVLVSTLLAAGGSMNCAQASAADKGPRLLSSADLSLYLTVIRAAAERAKHPTQIDRELMECAEHAQEHQREEYRAFESRHANGQKVTPDEITRLKASDPSAQDLIAIKHAADLRTKADSLIVEERGIDPRYWVIKKTVETTVVQLDAIREHKIAPARRPNLDGLAPAAAVAAEHAFATDQRNAALVRSHEEEIQRLLTVISHGRPIDID